MKSVLLNLSRPFIFSTALPLPVVAAARAAILIACSDDGAKRRAVLQRHMRVMGDVLGMDVVSPIIPIVVGLEEAALRFVYVDFDL